MAATAEAPVLQVGLLATMPDGSLRFVGEDGQIQSIATSVNFNVVREEMMIDARGCSKETLAKLDQMHNRVVMIDVKRSDPSRKLQATIKDYILRTLKEIKVVRASVVRKDFDHTIGENLEFEHALANGWREIEVAVYEAYA